MSEQTIQNIITQIEQLQTQLSNFNNVINNIRNKAINILPMIFIGIIFYIKNKYGNIKIIKVLLAILLIIFILYLSFIFVSTGTIISGIQSNMMQGLILAGFGGMSIDNNLLNINTLIQDIYTYIQSSSV